MCVSGLLVRHEVHQLVQYGRHHRGWRATSPAGSHHNRRVQRVGGATGIIMARVPAMREAQQRAHTSTMGCVWEGVDRCDVGCSGWSGS